MEQSVFQQRLNEKETDVRRLEQRRKQIDMGKNTLGYEKYVAAVPKHTRGRREPRTPPIDRKMSKRQWDGVVRKWRRQLHEWDPNGRGAEEGEEEDEGLDEIDAKLHEVVHEVVHVEELDVSELDARHAGNIALAGVEDGKVGGEAGPSIEDLEAQLRALEEEMT